MNITVNVVLPDILTALIERALTLPCPDLPAPAPKASPAPIPAAQEAPKADPKPRTAAKPAAAPAPSQPTAEAAGDAAPTTTASPSGDTPPVVSYDDVKAAVLAYGAKFGRDAIVDHLSRYGVTSGKALKTGVYAQFVDETNALIASDKAE